MPRQYQQTALLIGIILALVMRGIFIALGAAAIQNFSWVFYFFGAFLIYTAVKLATQGESDEDDFKENRLLVWVETHLPATKDWNGVKLLARVDGKRVITPMFIVIIALGTTDLLFALDSIPAIFGLTKEPYIVFAANVFALMGLRQLYFLIGGLLQRLVYLSLGLSLVLGFIGIKLVMEALHENELPFINGGEHVEAVPAIPIWASLAVIIGILVITTVASLIKVRRDPSAVKDPHGPLGSCRPSRLRLGTSSTRKVTRGPHLVGRRPRRAPGRLRRRPHRHGRRRPDDADDDPVLQGRPAGRGVQRPGGVAGDEAGRRGGAPAPRHRQQGPGQVAVHRLGALGVHRGAGAARAGQHRGDRGGRQDRPRHRAALRRRIDGGQGLAGHAQGPAAAAGARHRGRARSPSRTSRSSRHPRSSSGSSAA